MFFNIPILATLAMSIASTMAMPKSSQNWELVTNNLGYTTRQFKAGFEPGSEDYLHRFGDIDVNNTSILSRDVKRITSPFVGKTRIPYGCNTDIGNYVFSKLHELCYDYSCDEGSDVNVPVEYPDGGRKKEANVNVKVRGFYPRGSKDSMIRAIQAMVPQNGVEYYDVTSYGPIRAHAAQDITRCEVVGSSNFFKVMLANEGEDALVGEMAVEVSFGMGENGAICGTIATVAKEIAGAINGIAGGLFGIVQAVSCSA
ncbi:hypothetical protein Slin14017_G056000 [Septoria linicola]|nr:hypothetical protein Slin14017_G056000 [Septoria linicola]